MVINAANFLRIKKFILDQGKRQTYCNKFNDNPYWAFPGFNMYLDPTGQGNINCEIGKSEFNMLVIQVTIPGPISYLHIFLDENKKGLHIRQFYVRKDAKTLIKEASGFFQKALSEIERHKGQNESEKADSEGK